MLDVAPSCYTWLKQSRSNRAQGDARLLRLIRASFVASQSIYGAPRVFLDLREADGGSPFPAETTTANPLPRRQLPPAANAMLGAWVTVGLSEELRLNIAYNVREDTVTVEMRSGACNDPRCASTYRASVAQKELLIDRSSSTGGTGRISRASLNLISNGILAYNHGLQELLVRDHLLEQLLVDARRRRPRLRDDHVQPTPTGCIDARHTFNG